MRINQIVPVTYDDHTTFALKLERLQQRLNGIIAEFNEAAGGLELSTVQQSAPVPTSNVITASPVQFPMMSPAPHNAFPGLVRLPDGTYLSAHRAGSAHDSSDGVAFLMRSDDGMEWSEATPIPNDLPGDVRDVSLSIVWGELILTYYLGGGPNKSYFRRSLDGGLTWGASEYLPFSSGGVEFVSAPMVEVNGVALVTAYGNSAVRVLRSSDRGATWSTPIIVVPGGVQEPNLVPLGGNRVRILWRTNFDGKAKTALSLDGGLTWSAPADAYWGQGNPHVTRLRSGVLVATYKSVEGHSRNTYSFACARLSFDGGATWGPETVFGDASRKMAYAVAVETEVDNEMVCVWACETANTASQMYSLRLTHGGAITAAGPVPSPVTPRMSNTFQRIKLEKTVDQDIANNTWTDITFDKEIVDDWEGFNPARSQTEIRVNESGMYVVSLRVSFNNVTAANLALKPSGNARQILHFASMSGAEKDFLMTGAVYLDENDSYTLQVYRTHADARRLLSGDFAYRTNVTVSKIG